MRSKKKILFLCTGNSARSQMAEGLMRALGSHSWEVYSAGTIASFVHPLAQEAMKEIRIDISRQTSKSQSEFAKKEFDVIITLCDHAARVCPSFPGKAKRLHWPLDDPAGAVGTMEEKLAVFRRVRDEIKARIEEFLRLQSSDPIASFEF